jgi:hypothetical protein
MTMSRLRAFSLSVLATGLLSCADGTSPQPGGITTVTLDFCPGDEPAWAAFQDGDGDWRAVPATRTDVFVEFNAAFSSDRGAIAIGRVAPGPASTLSIRYGTPDELRLAGDRVSAGCSGLASKTWHGLVAGLESGDAARIAVGGAAPASASEATNFQYTLPDVASGSLTILAERLRVIDGQASVSRAILRHGVDLPDGASLPVLDFTSGEAFSLTDTTVRVTGLGGQSATVVGTLRSGSVASAELSQPRLTAGEAASFQMIPGEAMGPGDLQAVSVTTLSDGSNTVRGALAYFRDTPPRDVALGEIAAMPVIAPVPASSSNAEAPRVRAQFAAHADYDQEAVITYQQASVKVTVAMTAEYARRSQKGFDLAIPDLTLVHGFDPRWLLQSGQTFWTGTRIGGTVGLGLSGEATVGSVRRTLVQFGSVGL